jgi:exonuclease I
MINPKLELDFRKVMRVLDSCITEEQLDVSEKFLKLFIRKWSFLLTDENEITIYNQFLKKMNSKKIKLNIF